MRHPEGKSILLTLFSLRTLMWIFISKKNSLNILLLQECYSWPDSFKAASTPQTAYMKPPNQTCFYSHEVARKDFYSPRLPEYELQMRSKVVLWVGIANTRLSSSALCCSCSRSNENPPIKTNTPIKIKDLQRVALFLLAHWCLLPCNLHEF